MGNATRSGSQMLSCKLEAETFPNDITLRFGEYEVYLWMISSFDCNSVKSVIQQQLKKTSIYFQSFLLETLLNFYFLISQEAQVSLQSESAVLCDENKALITIISSY